VTIEEKNLLKESIKEEIQKLSSDLEEIKSKIYPDKEQDRCDKTAHLTQKLDQSVLFKRYEECVSRLNRLNSAILKVDTKDYGICQECEEPIPIERLKLLPESIYCVNCLQELSGF
jgi:DnaK suppressor protein